jgi:hypothetical protein
VLQLAPKLAGAVNKATVAVKAASEALRIREAEQARHDVQRARQATLAELEAARRRFDELRLRASRFGDDAEVSAKVQSVEVRVTAPIVDLHTPLCVCLHRTS